MASFDAICSAQKESSIRRVGPYLTLPYLTLPSEGADAGAIACSRHTNLQTSLSVGIAHGGVRWGGQQAAAP